MSAVRHARLLRLTVLFAVAATGSRATLAEPPGRADYLTYCAPCHGAAGDGNGPLANMLTPRPARHTDAATMSAIGDDDLLRLLNEGGPALGKSPLMGAWGKLLGTQRIRELLAYTRTLAVR